MRLREPAASAKSVVLFGVELDALTMREALATCRGALQTRERLLIGVLNAAKVVNLRRDAVLRESLLECDMVLADGQSVVWASHVLRSPLPERVTGIDLFTALLRVANAEHRSVYLLGARRDVLEALVERIRAHLPNVVIAGARDGYFADDESDQVAEEIRASSADMLFLGMVSPKKEIFLARHGNSLGVPILHGVGGSFDVLAGVTQRAPKTWQKCGMEWAYRFIQEPRRMWRRYLRTNTVFVALVVREILSPSEPFTQDPGRSAQAQQENS